MTVWVVIVDDAIVGDIVQDIFSTEAAASNFIDEHSEEFNMYVEEWEVKE